MHFSTLFTTTALLALGSAAPTPDSGLAPRSCAIEFPSIINSLDQKAPTTASGKTLKIRAAQDAGGNGREVMQIGFTNIPPTAYACALELYLPSGTPITNAGSSQIHVYTLASEISLNDTWLDAPAKGPLFGTTNVHSDPSQPTRIVLNSLHCRENMGFRVEIASEAEYGVMAFGQQNPPSLGPVGFRLTHSC